jgi:hypothetical protein
MKNIILPAAALFALAGCAKMNDTHQKFLDNGERIYVGKANELVVRGGYKRVAVEGLMNYAKTAETCIIRWAIDGKSDSTVVQASTWLANDTMSVIISNLPEGTQRFFVQTYDRDGNGSLNVECNGNVYGDETALTAAPKIITLMTPQPEGMYLSWNMSEEVVGVEMKWDTGDDGEKTMKVTADEETSLIPSDWKLGGTISTRSLIVPEEGAIDTLYTPWSSNVFPDFVEFSVDKDRIQYVSWPTNAATGYGGVYSAVFDGNTGTQFHSADRVGVPQHLVFDLGVNANLTRWRIYARDDNYHNWNPKQIQLWGIEEMGPESEITLPSADAGWEDSARAKGWTLLSENTCDHPIDNQLTITNPGRARYIIIRTKEVYGAPTSGSGAYTILREVWFWSDSIRYLD